MTPVAMLAEVGPTLDLGNLTGVSIGALLLALVFRTLWRQEGGWRAVLTASREDAALARKEAELARADSAEARTDAREARNAESECRRRLARVEEAVTANSKRLDAIAEVSGEIPRSPSSGE